MEYAISIVLLVVAAVILIGGPSLAADDIVNRMERRCKRKAQ